MDKISLTEAARRLNLSEDTIRRRVHKGELAACQEPTPQGFKWLVELPDGASATPAVQPDATSAGGGVASADPSPRLGDARVAPSQDASADTTAALRDLVEIIKAQLETKDRQIGELHILLQQAQKALPAPRSPDHPWWRRWWRGR